MIYVVCEAGHFAGLTETHSTICKRNGCGCKVSPVSEKVYDGFTVQRNGVENRTYITIGEQRRVIGRFIVQIRRRINDDLSITLIGGNAFKNVTIRNGAFAP